MLQVWYLGIKFSSITDANTEIAKHKVKVQEEGSYLVSAAFDQCIRETMRTIKTNGGDRLSGFSELLNYYAVYTQIYDLSITPQGSYNSYQQTLGDLRGTSNLLSTKLEILLQ